MKPGVKIGQVRRDPRAGQDKGLAKIISTPEWERLLAIDLGIEHPAAGVPDYEGLAEQGLTLDLLVDHQRLRF
jgi:hypothetical protein